MDEGGSEQPSHLDVSGTFVSLPREHRPTFGGRHRGTHGRDVCRADGCGQLGTGDGPQSGDRLGRGEGQVEAGHGGTRMCGRLDDEPVQLPRTRRLTAVLAGEPFAGQLGT